MIGKLRLIFWLGILMLFVPFLGIPNAWKELLAMLVGLVLIALAILLRKGYRAQRHAIRHLEHAITEQAPHHE